MYFPLVFVTSVLLNHLNYSRRPTPPSIPGRPRSKLPLLGGTLTVAIVETRAPPQVGGGGPARSSKARVLADLQQKSKLGTTKPSDEVEGLKFEIRWEPAKGALGVNIPLEDSIMPDGLILVVSFETFGHGGKS